MPEFKKGDLVVLKSGGPSMTVKDIGVYGYGNKHESAMCVYFDNDNKKFEEVFELETIMKLKSN